MTSMLMVSIRFKEPGLGLEFSVRKGLCRSMQIIWLWTELGWNSELRASVRSCQTIKGVTVVSNGEVNNLIQGSDLGLGLCVR